MLTPTVPCFLFHIVANQSLRTRITIASNETFMFYQFFQQSYKENVLYHLLDGMFNERRELKWLKMIL